MGLIKNGKHQGITMDWYYKVISLALNVVERQGDDGLVKSTQLYVKLGRYGERDGEMLELMPMVFEDVEKHEEISMEKVYEKIKETDGFKNAEDVFE